MAKGKNTIIFIVLMLSGIVLGGLLAELTRGVSWLSWLSFGQEIGFGADAPVVLDLIIFRLSFGFLIRLDVAKILGLLLAFISFRKFFR